MTKTSAKADNLITAVKTGILLDVDIHTDFRTLMKHKTSLSTWCTKLISPAPTPQEGSFSGDVLWRLIILKNRKNSKRVSVKVIMLGK